MYKIIWLKEINSGFVTWKSAMWLLVASCIFSGMSYLLLTNKELSLLDQTELMLLLAEVIVGVGLLIVTIESSTAITTEMESETIESLFLTPLTLTDFITGKVLASFTLWLLVCLIAIPYVVVASSGSQLTLPFIGYLLLMSSLGIMGMILVTTAVSLLLRSSKNTLPTSLIILLAFAIPALFGA
jgi:ABC-2 type transport system permease protein